MAREVDWIRVELAKQPDRERYNLLKDLETQALVNELLENFKRAAHRTKLYRDYSHAARIADRIGYTELFRPPMSWFFRRKK